MDGPRRRGAERLVEFDIQPIRSRRRVRPPPPVTPEITEVTGTTLKTQPVTATD